VITTSAPTLGSPARQKLDVARGCLRRGDVGDIMQTSSSERRLQNSVRIAYGQSIALSHEGFHEPFDAECVDLSPGGLSLRASCLPGVGETLTCHFAAPDAGQQIEVRGEVVWAHLEGHRGGEFGVRFIDVDALTVALISEMIGEQESRARRESALTSRENATAQLSVDGSSDTFTARLLRRSAGLVTFEQDLSFLRLGRGVSAVQGDDVQRGQIASVAVRLDGSTPKLMVTLRYEASSAPDDSHTRGEAVTAPTLAEMNVDAVAAKATAITVSHDTARDLDAPTATHEPRGAVTLTEFDAAFGIHSDASELDPAPVMSMRSEFDLPSAISEAESMRPPAAAEFDDEEVGPALFTTDPPIETKSEAIVEALEDEPDHDIHDDVDEEAEDAARYEQAAARMLGEREAAVHEARDAVASTVERCDPSVMFRVDDTDELFRPKQPPAALMIAAGFCLSVINTGRGIALAAWQQLLTKLLPVAKTHLGGLAHNIGPKAIALWSRAREQALPVMRSTLRRALDARDQLTQRFAGQSKRRRTTGFSVAPVAAAPSVNRRSQVTAQETKRPLQAIVLGGAAIAGLGLAGYALFSAPDANVVPVHREIKPAPSAAVATPATSMPTAAELAATAPVVQPQAITLPAVATALPAPSYEAGRIPAPSYPTIEHAAPAAPKTAAPVPAATDQVVTATGDANIDSSVVTSNAGQSTKQFGASSVRGRHFVLHMSAPVRALSGTADAGGFSVIIDGALSLDRAGPIAANHSGVARAMILNKGDRAELTIRFRDGLTPKYQVLAKADAVEITIEE